MRLSCFVKPWPVKVGAFFMPFQTRFPISDGAKNASTTSTTSTML